MKRITIILSIALMLITSLSSVGQVVTKTVDDDTAGTLRVELRNASVGATISFDPSIAGQTIMVTMGEIPIDLAQYVTLTINGDANSSTTIQSNGNSRIFNVSSAVAGVMNVNDITFSSGNAVNGGAILASGALSSVNVNNCFFNSNTATGATAGQGGGAIFNDGSYTCANGLCIQYKCSFGSCW